MYCLTLTGLERQTVGKTTFAAHLGPFMHVFQIGHCHACAGRWGKLHVCRNCVRGKLSKSKFVRIYNDYAKGIESYSITSDGLP